MRLEGKAQIYSVNEDLQQTKSLECEASLISLKELAKKKKMAKSLTEK